MVSQWGEFTWRAEDIGPDSASFAPIDAPSRFAWHRIDADRLEARQRWEAEGKEQHLTIPLDRIA